MKITKLRAGIAALAVGVALGVGGFAVAAFTEESVATANDGKGASMQPLTVTSSSTQFDNSQGLYPGHSADVAIVVDNPNGVAVDVTSVVPAPAGANVTGGTTPDNNGTRTYCEARLNLAATPTFTGNGTPPLRVPAGGSITVTLDDAVSLASDTDNRCQGMAFTTSWTVTGANA